MRIVRPFMRTVGGLGHTVQNIARLQEVARILIRHGFGWVFTNMKLPGLPRTRGSRRESTPERAVAAIQALGPTFIKLGQVLSTRPDVLPPAYIAAFQQLQDDVAPLPFSDIEKQLAGELGANWRDQILSFDDEPLATASIAQVHRAQLKDGREVVFKVQRPGIAEMIRADLSIIRLLVNRAIAEFPEVRDLDPRGVLAEFERSMRAELEFLREARNMKRATANFNGQALVRIPEVFDALTTQRVLCAEFLKGVNIRNAREAGFDMDRVGQNYLTVAYTMLFDHGFFHGDLHPGNVLVLPGEVIGLLDFGMVGVLTRSMNDSIVSLIFALERGDHRTIARIFFDIAVKEARVDYDAFERDTVTVVERYWTGTSVQEMQIGLFLMEVTQNAMRHRVRAPHAYTMFFKALLTTEGLAKALISEVDPLRAARPYVEKLISERFSSERMKEDLFYNLVTLSTLGRRLPITMTQVLDDLDQQRLQTTVKLMPGDDVSRAQDRRQNRLVFAIFAVTAAVCGSLTLDTGPLQLLGMSVLSWLFFMAAFPLFFLTLWMTIRNRG